MGQYSKYKYAASVIAVSTILAGCLNSETNSEISGINGQAAQAQATIYAQGLQAYATLAQGHITDENNWKNGNTAITQTIDLSTSVDYNYSGALVESLRAGYCRRNTSNPQDIIQVTWLDQADADGNFVLGGVGRNSGQNILKKLTEFVSADNLGIYNNNRIKTIGSTNNAGVRLPSHCSFDIPNGSPVLIFEMLAPELNTDLQDLTELKTISCDAGEVGHKVLSLTAKKSPDGIIHIGGNEYPASTNLKHSMFDAFWTEVSSNCHPEITIDNIDSFTTTSAALDMSAMIAAGTNAANLKKTVQDSIGNIQCKETYQTDPETGVEIRKDDVVDQFSTCTTPYKPEGLEEISEKEIRLYDTEDKTISCKRESNETALSRQHLGFTGTLTLPDWSGSEIYTRDIMLHGLSDNLHENDETLENMLFKDSWVGVSVECERQEQLTISCNTVNQDMPGTISDNRGYIYTRDATILGWNDPETYERNETERTDWVHIPGSSGCEWREELTNDLRCPIGQDGIRTETYEQTFSENVPGTGSWSAWTLISSTDTCTSPAPSNSRGPDPGPDPDPDPAPDPDPTGGSSCLLAGTRVLMEDGSEKAIEDIKIGDVTAGGRVLQTYRRLYDDGMSQKSEDLFMNNGGLFEYDGIEATGRHPLHLDNGWLEMGDNPNASPINGSSETIVYNILTEDHLIPVIGKSGRIYAFSDELNNIHDTAEKGRLKNASLFIKQIKKNSIITVY